MKNCPYCKKPLQEHWSYCHHCNKPLIVDLQNQEVLDVVSPYSNSDLKANVRLYDFNLINMNEIDSDIQKIDNLIENKIKKGEQIDILLFEKSGLLFSKKDYSLALKTLENALYIFNQDNDLLNMAIAHNEIGLIQEELGYFENSIYHFEKSIEILSKINDFDKLIKVYNNLANVYYLIKDIEHSYEYYDKALKLAERLNIIKEEIKTSSNLVDILFLLKEYDKIDKILKRNLEYFSQMEDPYGTIITLTKIGKLNYFLGPQNFNSSFQSLLEALEMINKIKIGKSFSTENKAKLEWEVLLYFGKLNLLQNKYKEAENYFFKSLESLRISEVETSHVDESIVLESLANLFEAKAEYKNSIDYYKLAGEIYYKFGDDLSYAESKYKIAQLYMKFDDSESIRYFEEALDIFKELNYLKKIAEIMHELGDIYANKGLIDLAISYFEKAKRYYVELNDEYNITLLTEKIKSLVD
ncbi:MAG: tetratricopeptide repeat protein [Promethearchaeota archaeon]